MISENLIQKRQPVATSREPPGTALELQCEPQNHNNVAGNDVINQGTRSSGHPNQATQNTWYSNQGTKGP